MKSTRIIFKTVQSLGACEVDWMLVKYMDLCDVKELFKDQYSHLGSCEVDWMFVKNMDLYYVKELLNKNQYSRLALVK